MEPAETRRAGKLTRALALRYLAATVLVLVAATAASISNEFRKIDRDHRIMAAIVGRSVYLAAMGTREWNVRNGGVYVPAPGAVPARPPAAAAREVVRTREGLVLRRVSHAEMTRLVAALIEKERGVRIRMTGASPGSGENAPDPWEAAALVGFARGDKESSLLVGAGEDTVFRYMAPLRADKGCPACHAGARPGDVLGGIVVSFDYLPFLKVVERRRGETVLLHAAFFAISLFVVLFFGLRLLGSIEALQESLQKIRRLEGLLPICAKCKSFRQEGADPFDASSWVSVEKYLRDRTEARFTHGLCPSCARDLYPELHGGKDG